MFGRSFVAERVGWAEVVKVERCDVEGGCPNRALSRWLREKKWGVLAWVLCWDWTASGSLSTREEGNCQTIALALALSDKSGSFCLCRSQLSQRERQPQELELIFGASLLLEAHSDRKNFPFRPNL